MNKQRHPTHQRPNSGRVWAGIIIIGIGAILLAGKLGFDWLFPHWIFNWGNMWPVMFIVIGLVIGSNSTFKNPAAIFFFVFGGFALLKSVFDFNLGPLVWPTVVIGIGLWLLLGKGKAGTWPHRPYHDSGPRPHTGDYEWDKRVTEVDDGPAPSGPTDFEGKETNDGYAANFTSEDYLKSTSVFSDIKKTVISKRFQGGEIVNVFGGTDVNLVQADIHQPIVIDVFQIFAGTKIIVPAHWKVQSEVVSVFGEVDDRRFSQGTPYDDQKIVYIKGTSIFGGITIKNI